MKTCIVGSRNLELDGTVALHILDTLQGIPDWPKGEILLRKPLTRAARPFEALVGHLAASMGFRVVWHAPEPGGRAMVFLRDVAMVGASDQVIAFFPEGDEMTGGTAHVVEKALDQQRPVRAYVVGDQLRLIGSEDWAVEGRT